MNTIGVRANERWQAWTIILCCGVSGVLYALVAPPARGWAIGLIVLAPLFVALRRTRRMQVTLLAGFGCGFVAVLIGCSWLAGAVERFAHRPLALGIGILIVYAVAEAGRFALAAFLFKVGRTGGLWDPLVFASSLVAADLLWPQVFTWPLGTPLLSSAEFAQSSAWGGAPALTFIVGLASGALGASIDDRVFQPKPTKLRAHAFGYLGVIVALWVVGSVRIAKSDWSRNETVRVALVQTGFRAESKRTEPEGILREHAALTRQLATGDAVDLAIWSETVVVEPVSGDDWERALRRRVGRDVAVPVLLGANIAVGMESEHEGKPRLTNSALVVAARSRPCRSCRYDKQRLVPFAEYDPFEHLVRRVSATSARYVPGPGRTPLDFSGHKLGVLICFESLSAKHVGGLVQDGAELLVNPSNDGWFAAGAEPELHLALAGLRAIETERFLVRVAGNGISAVIDPNGRLLERIDVGERRALTANVPLLRGSTMYSAFGDLPWFVVCSAMLAMPLMARLRARAKHKTAN